MCIHCYPDGFQYASVCHKAIAKCFIKRCKGNKIFLNDGSHVTIFALADTNTFHTHKLKQFVYAGIQEVSRTSNNSLASLLSTTFITLSSSVAQPRAFTAPYHMMSLSMIVVHTETSRNFLFLTSSHCIIINPDIVSQRFDGESNPCSWRQRRNLYKWWRFYL